MVCKFCFGGLCTLDMARAGLDLKAAVSYHGLLDAPDLPKNPIKADVLICHGYDDPMVPPATVVALADELTVAGADWQIHAYGGTVHAFTNPAANDPGFGTVYNPVADKRATQSIQNFFDEIFA